MVSRGSCSLLASLSVTPCTSPRAPMGTLTGIHLGGHLLPTSPSLCVEAATQGFRPPLRRQGLSFGGSTGMGPHLPR